MTMLRNIIRREGYIPGEGDSNDDTIVSLAGDDHSDCDTIVSEGGEDRSDD